MKLRGLWLGMLLLAATVSRAQTDVLVSHYDAARTGQNLNEPTLTVPNLSATTFGKVYAFALDGYTHAQPLYKSNLTLPGLGTFQRGVLPLTEQAASTRSMPTARRRCGGAASSILRPNAYHARPIRRSRILFGGLDHLHARHRCLGAARSCRRGNRAERLAGALLAARTGHHHGRRQGVFPGVAAGLRRQRRGVPRRCAHQRAAPGPVSGQRGGLPSAWVPG